MAPTLSYPQITLFQQPCPSFNPISTMNSFDLSVTKPAFRFDDVLSRLQKFSLSSTLNSSNLSERDAGARSYSNLPTANQHDNWTPRGKNPDSAPTSYQSNDTRPASSQQVASKTSSLEAFYASRSRVIRLYNLPAQAESFLSLVFLPHNTSEYNPIPVPATMWELREEYAPAGSDSVWAVFRSHEEASAALSLSGRAISVETALESDLEPFHKLQRFVLNHTLSNSLAPTLPTAPGNVNTLGLLRAPPMLRVSSSHPDLHTPHGSIPKIAQGDYTLSTNPPNPKTSFRLGDWICSSAKCAAHNFGRNLACIGCGCPRSGGGHGNMAGQTSSNSSYSRAPPSPRFNPSSNNITYYSSGPSPQLPPTPTAQTSMAYSQSQAPPSFNPAPPALHAPNPPKSNHPLLTPSGRAFALGGKVQNISSDPLNPCVMYWPDNEAFPEQGQIRPSGLIGIAQPPILNTGNRGPISHQPGDWICQKCNYLNWRRRKVCQTCLPYAEGNGDSISAAVQAERIALLTSVLTQTQLNGGNLNIPTAATQTPRSHSLTPPQVRRPFIDLSPPQTLAPPQTRPVHRSQSHFALGQQYVDQAPQYTASSPIYQTSGHRQPSPLYSTGPSGPDMHRQNILASNNNGSPSNQGPGNFPTVRAPAPLLPSFLQDIVQSPSLSPTSTTTSSVDLSSIEEYDDGTGPKATFARVRGDSGSDVNAPISNISNIWRLDGEESKSLSVFPLPNRHELLGGKKDANRERLRV